jgi:hypothetical protein
MDDWNVPHPAPTPSTVRHPPVRDDRRLVARRLRIQEALALAEHDLDRRGSSLSATPRAAAAARSAR